MLLTMLDLIRVVQVDKDNHQSCVYIERLMEKTLCGTVSF